ncbi:MAG TPA: threonine synthase, partial [Thermoanaerobaculia bacterium]|nr:threonine synthase [Thermoanaerobaculia bacterium]
MPYSLLSHLECTKCASTYEADQLVNVCTKEGCAGPLFARYDLRPLPRDAGSRARTIWRWHEVMPARTPEEALTLGEGGTP